MHLDRVARLQPVAGAVAVQRILQLLRGQQRGLVAAPAAMLALAAGDREAGALVLGVDV